MCGIFGIVTGEEKKLGPILVDAGRRLAYRGYDSVGCATFRNNDTIDLRKDVGRVDDVANRLEFSEMTGERGIVQLRWATFGYPSQVNAQPHLDSDGDLVGAHNGNVVNNIELRKQFISEGMVVRSENDGESCVHAVERYVDQGNNIIDSIRFAYHDLEGDYAFVIGRIGEDALYAIKKGSGLAVGIGTDFTCVSSDLPSLLPLTRDILMVQNGEIVILTAEGVEIRKVEDGELVERDIVQIKESMDVVRKDGYPHFMLKEIHEQASVAGELIHLLAQSTDINSILDQVKSARHLYLVGCGTSYNACAIGAVYLAQLARRPAIPVLAPQFIRQYGPTLSPQDLGIFVSQSGETKDVLNAIGIAQEKNIGIFGLVNVIGSTLSQVSDRYLPLACGYEISVPATKTFTNQVIAFLYLAMKLGGHSITELSNLPNLIAGTITEVEPQVISLVTRLSNWNDMYCLGYGLTYPIALEGALKLKEITYAHCEGMLSTEFKHGPLSAVKDNYPVIFIASPQDTPLLVSGINEVTCRGGYAIAIGEEDEQLMLNAHKLITLPKTTPQINALLAVLPLQLLAYHISINRGYDPDFPRNLSKTLTVD